VLTASIPGARMDARQLLTNPIDYPIEDSHLEHGGCQREG